LVDALPLGGFAALLARAAVVVSNDTGPVHLAEAVGAPTVGLYWVGNLINGAPVDRARHRPLISWTIHCPECGEDCTRDLYPTRTRGQKSYPPAATSAARSYSTQAPSQATLYARHRPGGRSSRSVRCSRLAAACRFARAHSGPRGRIRSGSGRPVHSRYAFSC